MIDGFQRRGWDSNPCAREDKRFSRPPRYDYLAGSVDKNYQSTALDNEIMQLVSKLDSETKEKLISTLRIWINN